jgi:hypothetical protein
MLARLQKKSTILTLLVVMQNYLATQENNFTVSYKNKYAITMYKLHLSQRSKNLVYPKTSKLIQHLYL